MKAQPMKQMEDGQVPCEPADATHVWICCPGPFYYRMLPVVHGNTTRSGTKCWSWNGDVDRPTLKPSVLAKGKRDITDEECERILAGERVEIEDVVCHSFITDGKIKFLNDSTHELAGKTLDLLDVELFDKKE